MRAVVQRVTRAEVRVGGEIVGHIGLGLLVLLGVAATDDDTDAAVMAAKIAGVRIFADGDRKMNLSLADVRGQVLLVSQFTLLGDIRKGRRPSFTAAAEPVSADRLVDAVRDRLRSEGVTVETGRFGAAMEVDLLNDGPVTIVIEVTDGAIV